MNTTTTTGAADIVAPAPSLEYDLIVSSGGSAAMLCGIGTLMACELAGITWRRIGGVSGGSIPTAFGACGVPAKKLVGLALESQFGDNLDPDLGLIGLFSKFRKKSGLIVPSVTDLLTHQIKSRPITGLWGSEPIGKFFEELAAGNEDFWPSNYWTLATTKGGAQVHFDKSGVDMFGLDGKHVHLADTPLPLGTAIRASCTIPGILAAMEYEGMLLFDGALSRDGICPVGVQIRHFGANPKRIIACRVNEDALAPVSGTLHRLARRVWRVDPNFSWGEETAGVIEFRPLVDHVHTLKFRLSTDAKWLAIMIAFETCLSTLALRKILTGDKLELANSFFDRLGFWRDAHPSAIGSPQRLTQRIEKCLSEHGLY